MAAAGVTAPAAPAAPAVPQGPDSPQTFDSTTVSLGGLEKGFMDATGPTAPSKRASRDQPPPNAPMVKMPGQEPTKPEPKDKQADPSTLGADPFDDEKPADKPADKPAEKPEEKPADPAAGKKTKEDNIRVLATERDTLKQQLQERDVKLKSLEAELERRKDYDDVVKSSLEQRRVFEEQENELRVTRFEASAEFKDKWLKPYQQKYKRAMESLKEFQVEIPGEVGADPTFRDASEQDFVKLYNLPEGPAWREARKMFGDAAPAIMQHRKDLKELQQGAVAAKAEYQQRGQELESQRKAQERLQQEETLSLWEKENQQMVEKAAEFLKEKTDDKEFNDTLTAARQMVDVAYSEQRKNLTPTERIRLDAKIKNSAVAFRTQNLLLRRARAELATMKAELEKLREGDPGDPKTGRTRTVTEPASLEEDFFRKTA